MFMSLKNVSTAVSVPKIGRKTTAMVNIHVQKMNEIVKNNLQSVNKDLLKDWIEEMDAGKWHRNI